MDYFKRSPGGLKQMAGAGLVPARHPMHEAYPERA
jgi:hypothetical protein